MQTRGIGALQFDAGTTATPHYGMELVMSDEHDGLVEAKLDAHDGYQVVGHYVGSTGDDNEYVVAHLSLE